MPGKKAGGVKKEKERSAPKGKAGPGKELREAARDGDIKQVKALATPHMVDEVDEQNFTSLLWAAWNGHAEIVEMLIERGADVHHADADGQTALFHASWYGHPDAVRVLIKEGADVNKADSDKETPLSAAARNGHTEVVRLLIAANADPRVRDKDGHNAVSRALQKGHMPIALLLEDYARVYSEKGSGTAVQQLLNMPMAGPATYYQQQKHAAEQLQQQQSRQSLGSSNAPFTPPPFKSPAYSASPASDRQPDPFRGGYCSPRLAEAVAPLDSLQQQLQARLNGLPGQQTPGSSEPPRSKTYDSLTVLTSDMVRLTSKGQLPPVGSLVRLAAVKDAVWKVLQPVKGGGVKLGATSNPQAAAFFGEPGDEAGPGLWCVLQPEAPQQFVPSPQAPSPAMNTPPHGYPPRSGETGSPAWAQRWSGGAVPFGAAGAREASMPLQGVPPPGSPRKSRYRKDNPAYRAKNACTVCNQVRPPLNYCEDCNEEMCGGCWVREHQNRKRRAHVPHPVEILPDDD